MLIRISEGSAASLAEQIASQVRLGVARGEIAVGEKLPPARELADSLNVNMHTVLRATRRMREAGVIEVGRGRGTTVIGGDGPKVNTVLESVAAIVADAAAAGISARELSWLIKGMA
jgi:GntR family transcriptional regulator